MSGSLGSVALRRRVWRRCRQRIGEEGREPVWAGLGRAEGPVRCWVELPNTAAAPDAFDVPAHALIPILEGGWTLRAWLHVHPGKSGHMSARDRRSAWMDGGPAWPGVEWVVAGSDGRGTRNLPVRDGFRARPFPHFCDNEDL